MRLPHTRRAQAAARVGLGLVAASFLVGGGTAGAQGDGATPAPPLGGFTGSAVASGLRVQYAPRGLLPTGPPLDLSVPDAYTTISTGPATFARASVADPGDLLANPDALLALASPDYPAGAVPPYPFRISAGSGVGQPSAESQPAPGLNARVTAEGGRSTAEATTPVFAAPAVANLGSMSSSATTETDGSSVRAHARSTITGIDILGLIHIDAVTTDVTATSSGGATTLEGGTTVVGASLLGTPITIDGEGIRAAVGGLDIASLLSSLGIRLTLPGPVELAGGSAGQLASAGLRLDIELSARTIPALGDLLDSLPPIEPILPGLPGVEDVLAAARAQHIVVVELGRGVVSLTARSATPRSTPPTTVPAPVASSGAPAGVTRPATPVARPAPAAPAPAAAPAAPASAAPAVTSEIPAASVSTGIGAIAVLLLLVQPFLGDRLARVAAAQLVTEQEICPWPRR